VLIPREGGYLVASTRATGLNENETGSSRNVTKTVIAARQRILRPYQTTVRRSHGGRSYENRQRTLHRCDDVPAEEVANRRPYVLLAGDAFHYTQPEGWTGNERLQAGQCNLGWKMASVLQGSVRIPRLCTHNRRNVRHCRELIDFDREWAKMLKRRGAPKIVD